MPQEPVALHTAALWHPAISFEADKRFMLPLRLKNAGTGMHEPPAFRCTPPTHACSSAPHLPGGEGEGLPSRAYPDAALLHARQAAQADVLAAAEDEVLINLIAHCIGIVLDTPAAGRARLRSEAWVHLQQSGAASHSTWWACSRMHAASFQNLTTLHCRKSRGQMQHAQVLGTSAPRAAYLTRELLMPILFSHISAVPSDSPTHR